MSGRRGWPGLAERFGGLGRLAAPALLLWLGVAGRSAVKPEGETPLREPLSAFPEEVVGYAAVESDTLSRANLSVLKPDAYLLRDYAAVGSGGGALPRFTLFVAWYDRQESGQSVHSPRNCLPGSGWEPTRHDRLQVESPYGSAQVNRYMVEHETGARALVFYWYQGRGRVEANEWTVKWDLLRDSVLERRSDEALVRLVVPLGDREEPSAAQGREVVEAVAGALAAHLPA